MAERPIYRADLYVGNEFELLVISFHQKLN
jgi:hypothetical protein